jgi:chemotaxis signal transduction protein
MIDNNPVHCGQAGHIGTYLSFQAGEGDYLLDARCIERVLPPFSMKAIPGSPGIVAGYIEFDGNTIPVIDLVSMFGDTRFNHLDPASIVITDTSAMNNGMAYMGLMVDSVVGIQDLISDQLEDIPGFGTGQDDKYVQSYANVFGRIHKILDIGKLAYRCDLEIFASPYHR